MTDLFKHAATRDALGSPLAERARPSHLKTFVGQESLVTDGSILSRAIESDTLPSVILWGPPGSGKTTLARIIARQTKAEFISLSAVGSGAKEMRATCALADERRTLYASRTIVFIDEIHRFNKSQQDILLPHVESGTLILIGATTENPAFEINAALLSRVRVLRLNALSAEEIEKILLHALENDRLLLAHGATVNRDDLRDIATAAAGDARRALMSLETAFSLTPKNEPIGRSSIIEALGNPALRYGKKGPERYDVISAFIKSMRDSDVPASMYWMARMVESGEDPLFIARRMIVFASEDVGNADPQALPIAVAARDALGFVGLPEGTLAMSQACTYLAKAPKSTAAIKSYRAARSAVIDHGALAVPAHLHHSPHLSAHRPAIKTQGERGTIHRNLPDELTKFYP